MNLAVFFLSVHCCLVGMFNDFQFCKDTSISSLFSLPKKSQILCIRLLSGEPLKHLNILLRKNYKMDECEDWNACMNYIFCASQEKNIYFECDSFFHLSWKYFSRYVVNCGDISNQITLIDRLMVNKRYVYFIESMIENVGKEVDGNQDMFAYLKWVLAGLPMEWLQKHGEKLELLDDFDESKLEDDCGELKLLECELPAESNMVALDTEKENKKSSDNNEEFEILGEDADWNKNVCDLHNESIGKYYFVNPYFDKVCSIEEKKEKKNGDYCQMIDQMQFNGAITEILELKNFLSLRELLPKNSNESWNKKSTFFEELMKTGENVFWRTCGAKNAKMRFCDSIIPIILECFRETVISEHKEQQEDDKSWKSLISRYEILQVNAYDKENFNNYQELFYECITELLNFFAILKLKRDEENMKIVFHQNIIDELRHCKTQIDWEKCNHFLIFCRNIAQCVGTKIVLSNEDRPIMNSFFSLFCDEVVSGGGELRSVSECLSNMLLICFPLPLLNNKKDQKARAWKQIWFRIVSCDEVSKVLRLPFDCILQRGIQLLYRENGALFNVTPKYYNINKKILDLLFVLSGLEVKSFSPLSIFWINKFLHSCNEYNSNMHEVMLRWKVKYNKEEFKKKLTNQLMWIFLYYADEKIFLEMVSEHFMSLLALSKKFPKNIFEEFLFLNLQKNIIDRYPDLLMNEVYLMFCIDVVKGRYLDIIVKNNDQEKALILLYILSKEKNSTIKEYYIRNKISSLYSTIDQACGGCLKRLEDMILDGKFKEKG